MLLLFASVSFNAVAIPTSANFLNCGFCYGFCCSLFHFYVIIAAVDSASMFFAAVGLGSIFFVSSVLLL